MKEIMESRSIGISNPKNLFMTTGNSMAAMTIQTALRIMENAFFMDTTKSMNIINSRNAVVVFRFERNSNAIKLIAPPVFIVMKVV